MLAVNYYIKHIYLNIEITSFDLDPLTSSHNSSCLESGDRSNLSFHIFTLARPIFNRFIDK